MGEDSWLDGYWEERLGGGDPYDDAEYEDYDEHDDDWDDEEVDPAESEDLTGA